MLSLSWPGEGAALSVFTLSQLTSLPPVSPFRAAAGLLGSPGGERHGRERRSQQPSAGGASGGPAETAVTWVRSPPARRLSPASLADTIN